MTKIEECWRAFEERFIPPQIPATPRYAMTVAYHRGAHDMIESIFGMPEGLTTQEIDDIMCEMHDYCHRVLAEKRTERPPRKPRKRPQ